MVHPLLVLLKPVAVIVVVGGQTALAHHLHILGIETSLGSKQTSRLLKWEMG